MTNKEYSCDNVVEYKVDFSNPINNVSQNVYLDRLSRYGIKEYSSKQDSTIICFPIKFVQYKGAKDFLNREIGKIHPKTEMQDDVFNKSYLEIKGSVVKSIIINGNYTEATCYNIIKTPQSKNNTCKKKKKSKSKNGVKKKEKLEIIICNPSEQEFIN